MRQLAIKTKVGAVVIGRNEGERLRVSLQSLINSVAFIVYVDSGSTDGSASLARETGAVVLELDMTLPFTAARARNAGFQRLRLLARTSFFRIDKAMSSLLFVASAGRFTGYDPG